MKILSRDDLKDKGVPYSTVHIWRLEKRGEFPRRVPLGRARHGWVEDEIDDWIASRIAQRDAAAPSPQPA
jgi:prophage regulatory protein